VRLREKWLSISLVTAGTSRQRWRRVEQIAIGILALNTTVEILLPKSPGQFLPLSMPEGTCIVDVVAHQNSSELQRCLFWFCSFWQRMCIAGRVQCCLDVSGVHHDDCHSFLLQIHCHALADTVQRRFGCSVSVGSARAVVCY
jgi:hypothetical protein